MDLFEKYNKYSRPVKNENESLEVNFGISLQQIIDVVRLIHPPAHAYSIVSAHALYVPYVPCVSSASALSSSNIMTAASSLHSFVRLSVCLFIISGGSRISQTRGVNAKGSLAYYLLELLPKTT